ncbi:TonB-dependent receptor [Alkanindiges hydrocarboniclasticus]|uniref:TonB-dependent receptor n=1 Tax=Alkanindiges hydrocarboniclasticus TaxID=1907941 RepID=A0A1S8CYL5_9GAMM|nr:TonB-dependent siderophore receptor [Alkanindiges hydrocarboniclasticus]ONG41693.1 TonB-dependent receptor [Alkanindiges hydrocarboniclasticus]
MFKSSHSTMKPLYVAMQMVFLTSGCLLGETVIAAETTTDNAGNGQNTELSTIVVTANKTAVTEGSESYTASSASTATKLNLSLRDTPQAVKVYTREYLDDRNIDSLQELMSTVTGVTASRTDERQNYYARGFQVDYTLIDGMPSTLNLSEGDMDLSIFDRVEVVKGANGLMTGAGNPAIGLNMIRKHANARELTGSVNASVGSWNNYSSSADISAPLNADGSLRGRVFVKHSDEDSYMDFYARERNVAYGAIDYDLTDSTSLSLAATYQELNRDGIRWGGLPAFYNDGSRTKFDRSLTVSSDWTYWNVDTTALFAGLKQKLYGDINLNLNYSYRRDDKESALLYIAGKVDKATNRSLGAVSVYSSEKRNDENNIDVYVSAPFSIAGREQEIIVGGSWNKNESLKDNFGTIQGKKEGTNDLDINTPNYLDFSHMNTQLLTPITNPNKIALNETTQTGVYLAGKFQVLDALKVVAGARLSDWEFTAEDGKGNREFTNELTPYFGVIYDVARDHSLYASYTDIFKPQNRRDENANYLGPIVGRNYETGVKSEWFDSRLNTALSIFRIEQDNYAQEISGVSVPVNGATNTFEQAYRAADGVVSEGVEFEMDGEINDNWGINFGIANFEAKDAQDVKVNTNNSRTTSNLFVKYKMDKWRAGAGLNYRSKIYLGTGEARIDQSELFLASAMLGYQVDPNISVQLNLENLFDKEYYEGIGANSMNYGAPRNATLGVRYKF